MTFEAVVTAVIVGLAVVYVGRLAWRSAQGRQGSCKACGPVCGCAKSGEGPPPTGA